MVSNALVPRRRHYRPYGMILERLPVRRIRFRAEKRPCHCRADDHLRTTSVGRMNIAMMIPRLPVSEQGTLSGRSSSNLDASVRADPNSKRSTPRKPRIGAALAAEPAYPKSAIRDRENPAHASARNPRSGKRGSARAASARPACRLWRESRAPRGCEETHKGGKSCVSIGYWL